MRLRKPKRLAGVLGRHAEGGRLKKAFDQINRGPKPYDRTTLKRWENGESTPKDGAFIAELADVLGDPEILSAWEEDTGTSNRELNDLVTRFRTLPPEQKRAILPELVTELFRDETANRTSFKMRVELKPGLTQACHRLDITLGWVGALPAGATVEVVADEDLLRGAYTRERCIFRELVPLDDATFDAAMVALEGSLPVLKYKPTRAATFVSAEFKGHADGVYEFGNPEVRTAEVRLSLCLPYPADLHMYPVMVGAYTVRGRATIKMVTDGEQCGRPHALHYLGHTPAWAHPGEFNRPELLLEIGGDDSLVEPNSGIIFFWRSAGLDG